VLKPLTKKSASEDEIFSTRTGEPMAISMDVTQLLKEENARVTILNGSSTGLAARTSNIEISGINVMETVMQPGLLDNRNHVL